MGLLINPSGRGKDTYSRVGTFEAWFKDEAQLRDVLRSGAEIGDRLDQAAREDGMNCIYLV